MLFRYKVSKISDESVSLNVQNVESLRYDKLGSVGYATMTSGARHRLSKDDFDMLESIVSRIPTTT